MPDQKGSVESFTELLGAFRSAVHLGDTKDTGKKFPFRIQTKDVFNEVIRLTLQDLPQKLYAHLFSDDCTPF